MKRRADDRLSRLLAECADLIQDGNSVSACLARYPEDAAELEPLLLTLVEVRQLRPVPPRAPEVAQQRRAQFVLAAQQMAAPAAQHAGRSASLPARRPVTSGDWLQRLAVWLLGDSFAQRTPMARGVFAMLLLVLVGGLLLTGVASAAESTLPGDWLYPVKTTVEDLRLALIRDPLQRDAFQNTLRERRLMEARTVADTGRRVRSLALHGEIAELHNNRWIVSGLEVLIDRNTRIIGTPVVGATVNGTMRAPGDYTLVVVYVEVEPPAGAAPALAATPTLPPTPVRVPPTATPSPPPTDTPAAPAFGGGGIPAVHDEPEDTPSPLPSLTPTQTATRTPTITRTPAPTATASATELPKPRDRTTGRIQGYVERIEGGWWTIDGKTVECDGNTQFSGDPDVGALVDANVEITPEGRYIGLSIRRIGQPNPTPSPFEFTDVVKAINGEWWTIGPNTVKVTGETQLENDPGLGDTVEVKAERRAAGEVVALRITALRVDPHPIQGIIESMNGDIWVINGTPVIVDGRTEIRGTPAIGATVQVLAIPQPDGTLVARIVQVIAPPTPTVTPMVAEAETATPTATPEPPTPALTPVETPTPTSTPEVAAAPETATATPDTGTPAP